MLFGLKREEPDGPIAACSFGLSKRPQESLEYPCCTVRVSDPLTISRELTSRDVDRAANDSLSDLLALLNDPYAPLGLSC